VLSERYFQIPCTVFSEKARPFSHKPNTKNFIDNPLPGNYILSDFSACMAGPAKFGPGLFFYVLFK
jgi:hypothetical protein